MNIAGTIAAAWAICNLQFAICNVSIPLEHALGAAAALFALGALGVLLRRNVVFILMSIELMLAAGALAFIAASARWGAADGQVMFLFILAVAAAEAALGLALILTMYRQKKTLDADEASEMRG